MKRSRSRIAAIAGFVGIFPALVVGALLAFEFSIPIDGFRARVAAALSDSLGCPLTIGGTLHLVTGTRPGIEGGDVRLDECRAIRVARASADRVRVRVDLWALFSREIRLAEISGEHLEAEVPTEAPVPSAATAGEPSRWTFVEIRRLHVAPARLLVRSASAPPRSVDFAEVDGSARAGQPMQLTLRGTREKEAWDVTAITATLHDALAGLERWPLNLTAAFAGANSTLRGSWTPAPLGLQGKLAIKSATAERFFRALGADAPELGQVEMTASLAASADHVNLEGAQLTGPMGTISGDARLAVHGGRPTANITLSAHEIDFAVLERWRAVELGAAGTFEGTLTRVLERLRRFDGELAVSYDRLVNGPFSATNANYLSRLEAGKLTTTVSAIIDGAPGEASIEIDARGPFAMDAHVSVKSLPRAAVTQSRGVATIDPRVGGLSATASARGATVNALLDDFQGQVTGKDLKLVVPFAGDRHEVRLRAIDIKAGRGEAVRANAQGTLSGEPLEVELIGSPLVDLIDDRSWAVKRLYARVGAARVEASGRIEQPRTAMAVKLAFDIAVSHLDQLAPLIGGITLPRVPGSLRGSVDTGPQAWRVDATEIAIGATRGSGNATARSGTPTTVALEMQTIAGDELAEIGESTRSDHQGRPRTRPSGSRSLVEGAPGGLPPSDLGECRRQRTSARQRGARSFLARLVGRARRGKARRSIQPGHRALRWRPRGARTRHRPDARTARETGCHRKDRPPGHARRGDRCSGSRVAGQRRHLDRGERRPFAPAEVGRLSGGRAGELWRRTPRARRSADRFFDQRISGRQAFRGIRPVTHP